MSHRNIQPALLVPGESVRALKRLPRMHDRFGESYLQELLKDHPELLPVAEIRDDVGKLLCVGREVGVSSGAIDNLYLSTSGYPVVVETKLWRNPEARREVLAQVLDYIKEVVKKDFGWFEEQWAFFEKSKGRSGDDLVARLSELSDDEIDESQIIDRVNRALARGDVIAMIVGDGIEARLQTLVEHLRNDSPLLRYSLALVEMACYESEGETGREILVVPRVVRNVEPIQRAYVHIDIAERLKGQLDVQSLVEPEAESGHGPRVTLNEEDLLKSVEKASGSKCRIAMQAFYRDLVESFDLELEFKAAAVMLKVPDPDEERPGVSVLAFEKGGRIYNTRFLPGQLSRWGVDKAVAKSISEKYWTALNAIDAGFDLGGIQHMNVSRFLPFMELADKLPAIKEQVGLVVRQIREAYTALEESRTLPSMNR